MGGDQGETAFTIEFTSRAIRDLERMVRQDRLTAERISRGFDILSKDPFSGKKLKGKLVGKRSLRVGEYRVIYRVISEERKITIVSIGHRREIYRR